MANGRWMMFVPPAVFGLLAGLFYAGMFRDNPDGLPSAMVGRTAPPVLMTQLGDAVLTTDELLRTGEVKLVNFWASWCGPCRVEHPVLEQLKAEGISIHGVNFKDDPAKALAFLAELGNPYVSMGADATGRMALNWGVYGVPETYVIDASGKVLLRYAGPITPSALRDTIRPALAGATTP